MKYFIEHKTYNAEGKQQVEEINARFCVYPCIIGCGNTHDFKTFLCVACITHMVARDGTHMKSEKRKRKKFSCSLTFIVCGFYLTQMTKKYLVK